MQIKSHENVDWQIDDHHFLTGWRQISDNKTMVVRHLFEKSEIEREIFNLTNLSSSALH